MNGARLGSTMRINLSGFVLYMDARTDRETMHMFGFTRYIHARSCSRRKMTCFVITLRKLFDTSIN